MAILFERPRPPPAPSRRKLVSAAKFTRKSSSAASLLVGLAVAISLGLHRLGFRGGTLGFRLGWNFSGHFPDLNCKSDQKQAWNFGQPREFKLRRRGSGGGHSRRFGHRLRRKADFSDDSRDIGGHSDIALSPPTDLPLPIGPLAPFQSTFFAREATVDTMESLLEVRRKMAIFWEKLRWAAETSVPLSAEEEGDLGMLRGRAVQLGLAQLFRLRNAEDFQALELRSMLEVTLGRNGLSLGALEEFLSSNFGESPGQASKEDMRLPTKSPSQIGQAASSPSAALEPSRLGTSSRPSAVTEMLNGSPAVLAVVWGTVLQLLTSLQPPTISSPPFLEDGEVLRSEEVRQELHALMSDHDILLSMGRGYSTFDPLGKLNFLDEMQDIQDRWTVFLGRLQLLSEVNADYTRKAEAYLASLGLDIPEFHAVMREAHLELRRQATEDLQKS